MNTCMSGILNVTLQVLICKEKKTRLCHVHVILPCGPYATPPYTQWTLRPDLSKSN